MKTGRLLLLLDQMIDAEVADALRMLGHHVVRVSDLGMSRANDAEILATATQDGYVFVTLDEDFGNWAVLPLKRHPGVIRLKVKTATTDRIRNLLVAFLEAHCSKDFADKLVIVRGKSVRWISTAW